jgi:predicted metalloendopeptidase
MLASARILSRVNTDVNPCDDFYSFACGQWVQDFKLPAGKQHWDTHNSLAEKSHVTVKRILDGSIKVATSAEEMALLTKAQKYYETCMNTDHLNDVSVKPLIPLLEDIVDLFPYSLQPEDEGYAKKMAETVAFLASYNVSVFVDFKVNKYDNSMELWPAEFAMPLELYEYQNYLNRYTQIMASMLTNVMEHPAIRARGQAIRDEQITNWYAVATSLISFEQDLARMRANE